jgi:hypothetical protein
LRRDTGRELNKGESRNSLARADFISVNRVRSDRRRSKRACSRPACVWKSPVNLFPYEVHAAAITPEALTGASPI